MLKLKIPVKSSLGLTIILMLFSASLLSQDTAGFSGFVHLTGGAFNYKTNTVAKFFENKVSNKVTNSIYTIPENELIVTPLAAFELKYTFKNKTTQLFFGSSILDVVRLDFVQQLAFRKLFKNEGFISIGLLLSTVPVALWEDPFMVNEERTPTDRESFGIRMEWANVAQSNFGVRYELRKIQLEEQSGRFLGLPLEEQKLLDRNGFSHKVMISYKKKISKNHTLIPRLNYSYHATAGESKRGTGMSVDMGYGFRKKRVILVTDLSIGFRKYKAENPIYNARQSNLEFSFVESGFYRLNNNPNRSFLLTASVAYVSANSNIDFFSQSALMVQAGIMLKFSPKSD